MFKYSIINLLDRPEMKERMADWFHDKWKIEREAYLESMNECLCQKEPVPQWYVAMEQDRIIGGMGVIENDFHNRKDLTPNVCAVYVVQEYRCDGIAGALLDHVCKDMKKRGISTLYLITEHTSFYERYGWKYFTQVQGDGEDHLTRMYIHEE